MWWRAQALVWTNMFLYEVLWGENSFKVLFKHKALEWLMTIAPIIVIPVGEKLWHLHWKRSTTQRGITLCAEFQLLWKVFETAQAWVGALGKIMDCTASGSWKPTAGLMSLLPGSCVWLAPTIYLIFSWGDTVCVYFCLKLCLPFRYRSLLYRFLLILLSKFPSVSVHPD